MCSYMSYSFFFNVVLLDPFTWMLMTTFWFIFTHNFLYLFNFLQIASFCFAVMNNAMNILTQVLSQISARVSLRNIITNSGVSGYCMLSHSNLLSNIKSLSEMTVSGWGEFLLLPFLCSQPGLIIKLTQIQINRRKTPFKTYVLKFIEK